MFPCRVYFIFFFFFNLFSYYYFFAIIFSVLFFCAVATSITIGGQWKLRLQVIVAGATCFCKSDKNSYNKLHMEFNETFHRGADTKEQQRKQKRKKRKIVSKRRTATNWNKSDERIDKWKTKPLKAKLSTREHTMHGTGTATCDSQFNIIMESGVLAFPFFFLFILYSA